MTTSVWSGGGKWGPSDNTLVWAPSGASPSGRPVPVVAIGGSSINNQVQSATWYLGPSDPFADLAPASATFTFIGQVDAEPDDDMVVSTAWGAMWGGRVVTVSETLGVDGLYRTTVTATDKVGQMAGAALRKDNGKTGDLVTIIGYLSRVAGVRVTVTDASTGTYGLPDLQRIFYFGGTTFTGSMLEYLNIAARSSNAMVALQPDGTLRVMTREALPSPPTTVTLSGDNSPVSWTKTLAWGNDVNRWSFAMPDGTDLPDVSIPADIRAHGERAFTVDNFLDVDTGSGVALNFLDWWGYTPAARWVVTDGQFVVSDLAQEELLTLAPLDWITVEDEDWQVMSMQWTIDGPGQPMRLTITADDFLATMSPAGDGLIISNIAATVSDTSVTITWDLSDFGQGWIEYGTTLAYGSETAHETSYDYDAHSQGISGLVAGTLYHFRIHAIGPESDPVETVSGDFVFAIADEEAEHEAGVRGTTPTLTPSGGTTTCGGSARTNVSIDDLDYPNTDEGEAVSWRPTGGHVHEIADGTSESAAKDIITAATSGTVSNPCIIQFASGSTFDWTTRYVFQAPRQYIILWGYGATVHSTGTATRTHFQYDGTSGAPLNHHMKILGFTLTGTHTDAGTTGAYGIDNAICIALYGQCEDFEIADVDIHNVWSDGIYLHGDSQSWVRNKRISIHHSLIDRCGRMNVTLDQCEDLWFIWNVVSNSAMYLIDVEDARHANQDMVNYYIRDNVFDSWCWDKEAFGASYFNQNAVAFVNNRAVGSYTSVSSDMSATGIYIERNQFFGGPRGWGSTATVVYQGETGIDNKFNEAICFGPASWSQSAGSNGTIPKTNVYIRDNDFSGVPAGVRGRGAITLTWCTTGEVTGNICPGYDIFSISNTGVTITGNTVDAVRTSWP